MTSLTFSYEYLLNHLFELDDVRSKLYKDTKEISDNIPYSYKEVDNKVYRMCNAYVVEKVVKGWLSNSGHQVEFIGKLSHEYFHPGEGDGNPDLIDELGNTFEIKSCNCHVQDYDWIRNLSHNADYVFFYDRYSRKLYNMDYDTKTYQCLADIEIYLPFFNR